MGKEMEFDMGKEDFSMNFRCFSRHRQMLYGVAALWILFYHCVSRVPDEGLLKPLHHLQAMGNCGVEIFLLLSGVGLYHSMQKGTTLGKFYKNRFLRVFLPSFLVMSVFGVLKEDTLAGYFGASTFMGYWFGIETVWYVSFILTMYLIYPLLYGLQKKSSKFLPLLTAGFIGLSFAGEAFGFIGQGVLRGVSRIPVFLIGCMLAPYAEEGKRVPFKVFPISAAAAVILTVLWKKMQAFGYHYFFRSLAYFFYAFLIIMAFCRIADALLKYRPFRGAYRCAAFLGGISLEIYLFFERMLDALGRLQGFHVHPCGNLKLDAAAAILTIFLSVMLQKMVKSVTDAFDKTRIPE